jgi:large subunit ribosomal protein L2
VVVTKKSIDFLSFYRTKNSVGITIGLEYDPNRNANIASIYDLTKKDFYYILATKNLKIGDIIKSGPNAEPKIGHSLPISKIPIGSYIHNISPTTFKPAQISRAAGTFSKIKEKTLKYAKIELSSGEQRFISTKCYATMGIVSNELIILALKRKSRSISMVKQTTDSKRRCDESS